MSTYHLAFSSDYKKVKVLASDESVYAEYLLDTASQSISVAISGTSYVLNNAADFEDPSVTIDVGAGAELGFEDERMGGIGIVDLRDVGMQDEPETLNIQFDLECTTFYLKYITGPFAFKVYCTTTNCISWQEV